MSGWSARARETVPVESPVCCAMSFSVTRLAGIGREGRVGTAKVAQSVAGIYALIRPVNRRNHATFRAFMEEPAESSDDLRHTRRESGVTDGARVIGGEPDRFRQPA